jgi:hypothetical protein
MYSHSLEFDKPTCVADARVFDGLTCTTLLIANPLEPWLDLLSPLQFGQCSEKDANRMATADSVFRTSQVRRELIVSLRSGLGRAGELKYTHPFVIEGSN